MNALDRLALIGYFDKRLDARVADDEAMRAYWAGRIDGHCLQNAIDFGELTALADKEGFRIDWPSALDAYDAFAASQGAEL